ncbi:MAG TPA: glycoside hydrolase family 3 C-terminal domain-containing protein [Polyangiaceae bacterium]|jgi:beta-glucosidase|nr:glycoside hydrolase family 3 C-terminal domain-containing protein [Polyangiaceae bacterium]
MRNFVGLAGFALLLAGCDSPTDSQIGPPHQPWTPRVCARNTASFSADTLDLCPIDPASLSANGDVNGVHESEARAKTLIAGWTESDELAFVQGSAGQYVGNVAPVEGLPALSLQDGPAGVARFSGVTAFPAPIALAATWDLDLVERWGSAMAAEERGKGAMIQLGPMMNLARTPAGGRIFEGFGEDPYLSAALAARDVIGIQSQKVVATAKHFVGNEQETNRVGGDSRIDERTLHEIYEAPFAASVAAGAASVMCSYNRVNGVYACENPETLRDLKTGLAFSGFVVSDWGATQSLEASANAGLDLEMPLGHWFGQLGAAVDSGAVAKTRLDDMVTRIVASLARVGVLDDPPTGTPSSIVTSSEHATLARDAASESITLLKNDAQILPLDPARSVLVVGEAGNTVPSAVGGGSAFVNAPYIISPLSAINDRIGAAATYDDGTTDSVSRAAAAADVAIVFVTVPSSEGVDRPSLATGLDDVIAKVAAANPNTIVVLNTPGAVLMPWLDQVRAVLVDWYPGQENGNALASVLYGEQNPSGKLPLTFPKSESDLPRPETSITVNYDEALEIGYRALDAAGREPLFAFGFGLSYTTFAYSNLTFAAGSAPGNLIARFELANTGLRSGTEIAELYLSFPPDAGEPPRVLRGFARATLDAGQTQTLSIELTARDFAIYDSSTHAWRVPSGHFQIAIGGSSRSQPLSAELDVMGTGFAP